MSKFLAVVKREYVQRVRTKMFIVATILGPLIMSLFGIVPALIFNIDAGGPTRLAVVDQTGKMFPTLQRVIVDERGATEQPSPNPVDLKTLNANTNERFQRAGKQQRVRFEIENVNLAGQSLGQIKAELNDRVRRKELDGYLILPSSLLQDGKAEFYGRNTGDIFTVGELNDRLSRAVRDERLAEAGISAEVVRRSSAPIELKSINSSSGEEHSSGEGFALVFGSGFVIYMTILMYGQMILGAVIEEKETRIAEILFSSVRPLTLMMGKLIGVSLVALTQLLVWAIALVTFILIAARGLPIHIPTIPLIVFVYFGLFFLLGYFIYATIYTLVGSMVTTTQEGGQLAMPVIILLVIGFYLVFPVIKSPDSQLAFWVSMFPFFSPITMIVRIVTQTPPYWQIGLSLVIGFLTVLLLLWIASRVYRIGMLMYGKKATIPEVWRWVRQP